MKLPVLLIAVLAFVLLFIVSYILHYIDVNHIRFISKKYDKHLNELMDKNTDISEQLLTIKFEGTDFYVWTGNYPYAYGNIYPGNGIYASMKTRKRLREYIIIKKQL